MNAHAARASMTIGDVLGLLRVEFPDVTISKIRFLESEGLIEPRRSPSGYRKFGHADVERLRFILAAQRDHYLPLRVIKEHLESGTLPDAPRPRRGEAAGGTTGRGRPRTLVAAGSTAEGADVRLTRRQLLDGAGIDEALLVELEEYGLIRRAGAHYSGEALAIARAAAALGSYGVEVRHLRAVKAAAERELGLIEQVIGPLLRRRSPDAHDQAEQSALEIAAHSMKLHGALVASGLRETLRP